jgi:C-terminal processing protease CtpA/Prc
MTNIRSAASSVTRSNRLCGVAIAAFVLAQACQPAPRRALTTDEKVADLHWVYSQFNHHYAPLQYKEQLHGIDFQTLRQQYLTEAASTKSNEEFYLLMHRFVAEFRDAHTSSSLMASANSPGRVSVAALGFAARRTGDVATVTELLPTTNLAATRFPVQIGDRIARIDGVPVRNVALEQAKFRHLGHEEANLSYHIPRLFMRQSIAAPMPASSDAVLTVIRKDSQGRDFEFEAMLPWVTKDVIAFTAEQAAAKKKAEVEGTDTARLGLSSIEWNALFQIGSHLGRMHGSLGVTPTLLRNIRYADSGASFWNSFLFVDHQPEWTSLWLKETLRTTSEELKLENELTANAAPVETAADRLRKRRFVPRDVIWVNESKTFPIYVRRLKVYDASGKATGDRKLVATLAVDTFSPSTAEAVVLKEMEDSLRVLQGLGVEEIVVDLVDNGGGSLTLGAQLAQLFSRKKLVMPEMQFGLNETWLDQFETLSQSSASDSEKEIARRVFAVLKDERAKGNRLSSRFNLEALTPFAYRPNLALANDFKLVLVVNEMCASMCDIFTAILKDNGLATVIGARTMGAGGNVVQVSGTAPNSNLYLNQTQSLILRMDGSYIENNGVTPDVVVDVNATAAEKYASLFSRASEEFVGKGNQ